MSQAQQQSTNQPSATSSPSSTSSKPNPDQIDAVIVGAGFSGLYMLHKLRSLGFTARVFEAGSGVGGTWFWNRYPGARCDIESMEYSYQFDEALQQEWNWPERYSSQPEILKYANHVADRFDLWRDIELNTRVTAAVFNETSSRWDVRSASAGAERATSTKFVIMATGCLSSTNIPQFKGLENFKGATYHTGSWPHEGVDFTGKRVGIIGTGSSAIQSIPHIAEQASHLYVFQRTPNYSVPAQNGPLDPALRDKVKARYAEFRAANMDTAFGADFNYNEKLAVEVSEEERLREYEARWEHGGLGFLGAFADLLFDTKANDTVAEFIRAKVKNVVKDPALAEKLSADSVVGCKRLCADTGYFETYNRANVTLVDVRNSPIEELTAKGIRANGEEYAVDAIVFATGFDAMTGAISRVDIRGKGGMKLNDKWAAGPRTYLGLTTVGFPNLFTITGPGSPSVLSNMLPSIEQHVRWIAQCMHDMQQRQAGSIEPTLAAEDAWVEHVNEVAHTSLYPNCNSWYLGANVPGKPRVFMPYLGFNTYVAKCNEVVAKNYEGFVLTQAG